MITIAIPVYEGVNLLDVAGPFEMFSWINGEDSPAKITVTPRLLSCDGQPVLSGMRSLSHRVGLQPSGSFADVPHPEVLWVPGGDPQALSEIMREEQHPFLRYIREAAARAKWVCSVCEGALLAGRAGLLEGHEATTHWAFLDCLKKFPGVTVADHGEHHPRFVLSGNRLTGGGVSSGLDESLRLIELLTDTATATFVQTTTQYFPKPPVHGRIPADLPKCFLNW
jgi:transcriptional regulator GlxA family with amidase domain